MAKRNSYYQSLNDEVLKAYAYEPSELNEKLYLGIATFLKNNSLIGEAHLKEVEDTIASIRQKTAAGTWPRDKARLDKIFGWDRQYWRRR